MLGRLTVCSPVWGELRARLLPLQLGVFAADDAWNQLLKLWTRGTLRRQSHTFPRSNCSVVGVCFFVDEESVIRVEVILSSSHKLGQFGYEHDSGYSCRA